jgi:hypothetical protein
LRPSQHLESLSRKGDPFEQLDRRRRNPPDANNLGQSAASKAAAAILFDTISPAREEIFVPLLTDTYLAGYILVCNRLVTQWQHVLGQNYRGAG